MKHKTPIKRITVALSEPQHAYLESQAAANHRSVAAEAGLLISLALGDRSTPKPRRK